MEAPKDFYHLLCRKYIWALKYRLELEVEVDELKIIKTLSPEQRLKYRYIRTCIPSFRIPDDATRDDAIEERFKECVDAFNIYECLRMVLVLPDITAVEVYNGRDKFKKMYVDIELSYQIILAIQIIGKPPDNATAHSHILDPYIKLTSDAAGANVDNTVTKGSENFDYTLKKDDGIFIKILGDITDRSIFPPKRASHFFPATPFSHIVQGPIPYTNNYLQDKIFEKMQDEKKPLTVVFYGQDNAGKTESFLQFAQMRPPNATHFSVVEWIPTFEGIYMKTWTCVQDLANETYEWKREFINNHNAPKTYDVEIPMYEIDQSHIDYAINRRNVYVDSDGKFTSSVLFLTFYAVEIVDVPLLSLVDLPGNELFIPDANGCKYVNDLFQILIKNKQAGGIMSCDPPYPKIKRSTIEETLLGRTEAKEIIHPSISTPHPSISMWDILKKGWFKDLQEEHKYTVGLEKLYRRQFPIIYDSYSKALVEPYLQNIHSIALNNVNPTLKLLEFPEQNRSENLYGFPFIKDPDERLAIKEKINIFLTETRKECLFDIFKELRLCENALLGVLNNPLSKLIVVSSLVGSEEISRYGHTNKLIQDSNRRAMTFFAEIPVSKHPCGNSLTGGTRKKNKNRKQWSTQKLFTSSKKWPQNT